MWQSIRLLWKHCHYLVLGNLVFCEFISETQNANYSNTGTCFLFWLLDFHEILWWSLHITLQLIVHNVWNVLSLVIDDWACQGYTSLCPRKWPTTWFERLQVLIDIQFVHIKELRPSYCSVLCIPNWSCINTTITESNKREMPMT